MIEITAEIRAFISCPVILFLLYLFCAEMSAGFL